MLDRITGMTVFTRAATAGSISAAARQLNMSAGMATKHLDALEARLGVKLLHRSTRRLNLTEAGRNYLEACARILPELEEADALATEQRAEATGLLRFSAPLSFGVRYIAPLLPAFSELHPMVKVELGLNDRVVDLVEEGWDMTVRIGELAESRLTARKLAATRMVVCAAPAYWQARGMVRAPADLARHSCLRNALSKSSRRGEWVFGAGREIKIQVDGPLVANNGDALAAAAIAGLGIVYEPEFIVADALRAGALTEADLNVATSGIGGIHVVFPPERRPPLKVRAMIDFLARNFAGKLPWETSHPGDKIFSRKPT